jgi:hypothetical protein
MFLPTIFFALMREELKGNLLLCLDTWKKKIARSADIFLAVGERSVAHGCL